MIALVSLCLSRLAPMATLYQWMLPLCSTAVAIVATIPLPLLFYFKRAYDVRVGRKLRAPAMIEPLIELLLLGAALASTMIKPGLLSAALAGCFTAVAERLLVKRTKRDLANTTDLRFAVGQRVECRVDVNAVTGWAAGTVTELWYRENNWTPGRFVPYRVQLDDGRVIYAPQDVEQTIRSVPPSPTAPQDAAVPAKGHSSRFTDDPILRFVVGQRVECLVRADIDAAPGWVTGTVTQLWYRETNWATGCIAPYQVQLDDGRIAISSKDVEQMIRIDPRSPAPAA